MASTGESVSYAEYEARANRLAHLLRARGLGRLDHYAIFMENNDRYLEACAAGERAGLYYTCVNSYLTAPELAYIINNSTAKLLITSRACRDVALEAARARRAARPGRIPRARAAGHARHAVVQAGVAVPLLRRRGEDRRVDLTRRVDGHRRRRRLP